MLTIFLDNNGVFTDESIKLENYLRDSLVHQFVDDEDALYVGYYKPITSLYLEIEQADTSTHVAFFEYYNGTSFTSLAYNDWTNNFNRPGFMRWTNPSDIAKTTINSTELFWYKLYLTGHDVNVTVKGINQVFCDDIDLKEVEPNIDDFLNGLDSFIGFHQAARNEIIQTLNNSGNVKLGQTSNQRERINIFDLLDPSELKVAAKYLTLAKIFDSISDRPDDNYFAKSVRYYSLYQDAYNVYLKSIDLDDDGQADSFEKNRISHGRIILV